MLALLMMTGAIAVVVIGFGITAVLFLQRV
jgi:hypothetical protein